MSLKHELSVVAKTLHGKAWLNLLRWCEGTDEAKGYYMLFGGELVPGLATHPRRLVTRTFRNGKTVTSSAAGAYQFLAGTWDECAKALDLPDFSPDSQDVAALWLTRRRGALRHVVAGRWEAAIAACNREWASLPGSPYGQPTKTLKQCMDFLTGYIAQFPLPPPPVEEVEFVPVEQIEEEAIMPLPALATAALSILTPILTTKVKEVVGKETDAATAEEVTKQIVKVAQDLTGQADPVDAAMKVRQEPSLQSQLNAQMEISIPLFEKLFEASEKSAGAAREFNTKLATKGVGFWKLPAFWVTMVLIPLAYVVVFKVLTDDYPPEIKGAVIMAVVVATLADVRQFWLGSSHSSQRKDEMR